MNSPYKEIFRTVSSSFFLINYKYLFHILKEMNIDFNVVLKALFVIIIMEGIFGNAINMIVFSRRKMRKSLTFRLLFCLSVIDFVILTQSGLEALVESALDLEMRTSTKFFCKFNTFLAYFLTQTRNVLCMSITVERALKICKHVTKNTTKTTPSSIELTPESNLLHTSHLHSSHTEPAHGQNTLTTSPNALNTGRDTTCVPNYPQKRFNTTQAIRRFQIILCTVVICLLLANTHYLVFLTLKINLNLDGLSGQNLTALQTHELVNKTVSQAEAHDKSNKSDFQHVSYLHTECSPSQNIFYSFFLAHVWIWIDVGIYFLIPFVAMSTSLCFIFKKLRKLNRKYAYLMCDANYRLNTRLYLRKIKKNNQFILTLLVLNTYFLFSTLPYHILTIFIGQSYFEENYIQRALNILFYSNFGLNFFFFGLSSQTYRKELFTIVKRKSAH